MSLLWKSESETNANKTEEAAEQNVFSATYTCTKKVVVYEYVLSLLFFIIYTVYIYYEKEIYSYMII